MSVHPRQQSGSSGESPDQGDPVSARILVVTEARLAPGTSQAAIGTGTLVAFPELTMELLKLFDPHTVFTPLVSPSFDCTDVARLLTQAEFTGEMRVLCGPLPRPELVAEELQRTFPTLDVDLWVLPPG